MSFSACASSRPGSVASRLRARTTRCPRCSAASLDVSNAQAKLWLQRLVDENVLEKQKKPAGYVIKQKQIFE
jgi:cytochrome c-type biogenesis protein CcmH/NrfF